MLNPETGAGAWPAGGGTGSDIEAFRHRCREFLKSHVRYDLPSDRDDPRGDISAAEVRSFQRQLAAAGLAGLIYPVEYGGQGLGTEYEAIWREEVAAFPPQTRALTISLGMCLPVLNEFGTPEQKRAYLAKLISAEEMWAQMFSEPDAGSDVASLRMRAIRDGDRWVLNGTKVWTTLAHVCERAMVLARSDPSLPKHRGLSMFIVDLRAAGVEISPIRQIDGRSRFNEISFTDVEVPADHLIPPENGGWQVATAMLMYERVAIGGGQQGGVMTTWTDCLVDLARCRGLAGDPIVRDGLARLYGAEVIQSLVDRRVR